MPRELYQFDIDLTLQGPVLTKATEGAAIGLDALAARDEEKRFHLPRTLIKGKLREAWTELEGLVGCDMRIAELLGDNTTEQPDKSVLNQRRGLLQLTDLAAQQTGQAGAKRYRIRMDKKMRSADQGAYIVSETPFGAGEKVLFHGSAEISAATLKEAEAVAQQVRRGLIWADAYGSGHSIGFGRCLEAGVSTPTKVARRHGQAAGRKRFGIQLRFDRPFCFAGKRPNDTLFESEDFVSGANIKGSVAMLWNRLVHGPAATAPVIDEDFDAARRELGRHFWQVRFTHSLPADPANPVRPVRIPESVVAKQKEARYWDLALTGKPCLLSGQAPAYQLDWKSGTGQEAKDDYGWTVETKKQLRVRTAFSSSNRKSEDGKLFGQETVLVKDRVWIGEVDLSRIDEGVRRQVEDQLLELLSLGLREVGKTKASVTVAVAEVKHKLESAFEPVEGLWVVTLQSAALLCDPRLLKESSGKADLFGAYRQSWHALSGKLTLKHFYARQTLAGGTYLHRRFQGGGEYKPFLLTEPGSVFVFEGHDGTEMKEWVSHGLPVPQWVYDHYGAASENLLWQRCPYIRQNGYGEITVNLSTHLSHKPVEGQNDYAELEALQD